MLVPKITLNTRKVGDNSGLEQKIVQQISSILIIGPRRNEIQMRNSIMSKTSPKTNHFVRQSQLENVQMEIKPVKIYIGLVEDEKKF